MNNMDIYNKVKAVPEDAQKEIKGGRLKGMTDISPMWRIEKLTELFGACGQGWGTSVVAFQKDEHREEVVITCTLELWYKLDGTAINRVFGVGSSKLVAKEVNNYYVDDEAYKKAYTDAISVAAKSLGVGAEIYRYGKSSTGSKYEQRTVEAVKEAPKQAPKKQSEKWEKPFVFTEADIYELCRIIGKTIESVELYSGTTYGANVCALKQEQRDELGNMLWATAEKKGLV